MKMENYCDQMKSLSWSGHGGYYLVSNIQSQSLYSDDLQTRYRLRYTYQIHARFCANRNHNIDKHFVCVGPFLESDRLPLRRYQFQNMNITIITNYGSHRTCLSTLHLDVSPRGEGALRFTPWCWISIEVDQNPWTSSWNSPNVSCNYLSSTSPAQNFTKKLYQV